MDDRTARPLPPLRPEREFAPETMATIGDVARPLTSFERLTNITLVRRLVVILVLAAAWEIYARYPRQSPAVSRRSATRSPRSGIPPRTAR